MGELAESLVVSGKGDSPVRQVDVVERQFAYTACAAGMFGARRHNEVFKRFVASRSIERTSSSVMGRRSWSTGWLFKPAVGLAKTRPFFLACRNSDRSALIRLCRRYPETATGKPLRVSIKNALINLHCFLTRITEWGYPAPVRPLMFPGDLPIIDKPLPRFLDDAAAAKLLHATRADPDPLSRLIVELLARTGLRPATTVVQIGFQPTRCESRSASCTRPLHPAAPAAQRAARRLDHPPPAHRTAHESPSAEHDRPISHHHVTKALRHAADTAGSANVTAHQLRHTQP